MVRRQLSTAIARSASVSGNCTSFSASAKVAGETSGPTSGPVPNAGGSPGGRLLTVCREALRATAAPSNPSDVVARNFLRDFDIVLQAKLDGVRIIGSQTGLVKISRAPAPVCQRRTSPEFLPLDRTGGERNPIRFSFAGSRPQGR